MDWDVRVSVPLQRKSAVRVAIAKVVGVEPAVEIDRIGIGEYEAPIMTDLIYVSPPHAARLAVYGMRLGAKSGVE